MVRTDANQILVVGDTDSSEFGGMRSWSSNIRAVVKETGNGFECSSIMCASVCRAQEPHPSLEI